MKRYIEVSKHTGGRTITQRYPAREVRGLHVHFEIDRVCRACGHTCCSCPPAPVAPAPRAAMKCAWCSELLYTVCCCAASEPPADVLPEGWAPSDEEDYRHVSGAYVWQGKSSGYWYAERTGVPNDQTFYTRDAAMAAALASVPKAEFKVGDRVRIMEGADVSGTFTKGCVGTVTGIARDGVLTVTEPLGGWQASDQNSLADRASRFVAVWGSQPGKCLALLDLLTTVRREALEEAAKVADAAREKWLEAAPPRAYEVAWSATVALDLAERIRALKDGGK